MKLTRKISIPRLAACLVILSLDRLWTMRARPTFLDQPRQPAVVRQKRPIKTWWLGFAQVGAESEWRTGNTESIKTAAEEPGR